MLSKAILHIRGTLGEWRVIAGGSILPHGVSTAVISRHFAKISHLGFLARRKRNILEETVYLSGSRTDVTDLSNYLGR